MVTEKRNNPDSQPKVLDFMRLGPAAFVFSLILMIASIGIIVKSNFNWGLDFTGGTLIEVTFSKSADLGQVRDELQKPVSTTPLCRTSVLPVMLWCVCHRKMTSKVKSWVAAY